MRAAGRRAAVLWAVVATLLATLVPGASAADGGADVAADRVVVVGVPGLVWTDVDPEATPELWGLAEESPVGAMSVRAARSTTCVLDGWATLGAGNRARFPGPDEGLPPVPMPQVPLPDDEAAPEPAAPEDGADAEARRRTHRPPPWTRRWRTAACRSGSPRSGWSSPRRPSPGRRRTRAPPGSARSRARWATPSAAPRSTAGPR